MSRIVKVKTVKVTAPEGYVAVDRVAGAVKIVDRLEFSRANFTIAKRMEINEI